MNRKGKCRPLLTELVGYREIELLDPPSAFITDRTTSAALLARTHLSGNYCIVSRHTDMDSAAAVAAAAAAADIAGDDDSNDSADAKKCS